jgi:signal transduction histidine kinase
MAAMRPELWLELAGFGTWLVCGIPAAIAMRSGKLSGADIAVWAIAFAAFGAAFAVSCVDRHGRWQSRAVRIVLLAIQSVSGLTLLRVTADGMPGALTVVVAGQLLTVMGVGAAMAWVAAQSAALTYIASLLTSSTAALTVGGSFTAFQLFALATASLARRERIGREALARTNAELHATRALLAENSRVDERLRIARDLHDALGHHLTALSLQLDVAARLSEGAAADHVRQAHAITRLLLGDVRDVVSRMRDSSRIDLAQAIRTLAAAPADDLQIHLEIPDALAVDDSARAQALLRCVQEIITNTARHAAARNLWIRLVPEAGGIALHARDDGRGAAGVAWGNGLRGMRERFEEYSGRVDVGGAPGRGFEVHGFMPRPQAAP